MTRSKLKPTPSNDILRAVNGAVSSVGAQSVTIRRRPYSRCGDATRVCALFFGTFVKGWYPRPGPGVGRELRTYICNDQYTLRWGDRSTIELTVDKDLKPNR